MKSPGMNPEYWRHRLPGLASLWRRTHGAKEITVAVLDGAVDLDHPCFVGADLRVVESVVPSNPVSAHGTGVASILFGQPSSGFSGLAPGCRGLIIPIFAAADKTVTACSQVDLARAIGLALKNGANVINISGGQLDAGGEASPILAKAIENCAEQGVLVVAAAGNDGCECLHVPAAEPSVLAVGAMDDQDQPIDVSNWGKAYQSQGIVAPGQDVPAAIPGGGANPRTGTSWATPVVAGVAALLLSLQREQGQAIDAGAVREVLLATARGCDVEPAPDCRRLLVGRLNVAAATARLAGVSAEEPPVEIVAAECHTCSIPEPKEESPEEESTVSEAEVPMILAAGLNDADEDVKTPSVEQARPVLVYALGRISYDFGTEGRRDSFLQHGLSDPHDADALLAYLAENPAHATALTFTLLQEATPIYAIVPTDVFAAEAYERLRELMNVGMSASVERVSIPGWTHGTRTLMNGNTVPVIYPELRGVYGWSTASLVQAVFGERPRRGKKKQAEYEEKATNVANFLERIYHEIRNLGLISPERAMNYAATRAFELGHIYNSALRDGLKLSDVGVEPSPICRPGSDCWDVKLTFFDPVNLQEQARKIFRFTVDVSDVVPVTVGLVREWYAY